MHERLDEDLHSLFRESQEHFDEEPFVSATAKLVKARTGRRRLAKRLFQALGVISIVLLSPWLIEGSVQVSDVLDQLFATTSDFAGTPTGIATLLLCSIPALIHYRRRRR